MCPLILVVLGLAGGWHDLGHGLRAREIGHFASAPNYVQDTSAQATAATSCQVTLTSTPAAGDTVILFEGSNVNGATPGTPTWAGGTFTAAVANYAGGGAQQCSVWICSGCTASSGAITATISSSGSIDITALEVTGLTAVDVAANNNGSGTTLTSGTTSTTTNANELWLTWWYVSTSTAYTINSPTNSYTLASSGSPASAEYEPGIVVFPKGPPAESRATLFGHALCYYTASSTGTAGNGVTCSISATWIAVSFTIYSVGSLGGGYSTQPLLGVGAK